ncbi:MAG: sensor histidine kinase [Gemmataceae bacterium]|nr:sensor histidine kinase [Gemmataceae bacterium]
MSESQRERKPTSRRRAGVSAPAEPGDTDFLGWNWWRQFGSDWLYGIDENGKVVWASSSAQAHLGTQKIEGIRLVDLLRLTSTSKKTVAKALREGVRDAPVRWHAEQETAGNSVTALEGLLLPAEGIRSRAVRVVLVRQPAPSASDVATGAMIAHEVSQPLTAAVTHLQAYRRLTKGKHANARDAGQAIEGAMRAAERAAETVTRMRDWAMGHALPRTSEDAGTLLREAVELLQPELTAQKVEILWEVEDSLRPVWVNAGAVVQVATNLIRNSLEAMRGLAASRQKLTLRAYAANDHVEAAISDLGRGVSIAMIDRLFEPFQTTKPSGMGLGLSLSRTLVQTLGGALWVRPNPQHGCTFFFTLPKAPLEP